MTMAKKYTLNQTINDLIAYLQQIKKWGRALDEDQKDSLQAIIKTIVVLLVSLKKSSNLGSISSDFFFKRK